MSATGRGPRLGGPEDFYATPSWCVDRLLDAWDSPAGFWLEPSAGDGAIIRAVNRRKPGVKWIAVDIRPECEAQLIAAGAQYPFIGDFMEYPGPTIVAATVVIGNPPYTLALEFIQAAQEKCPAAVVCFLLRLNFAAGGERAAFMRAQRPSVKVLPNRPSFRGGLTDSCEYAWFVFDGKGTFEVLRTTPKAERCGKRTTPKAELAARQGVLL